MVRDPAALAAAVTDEGVPERYEDRPPVGRSELRDELTDAVERIDANLSEFYDQFPAPSSDNLVYPATDNMGRWTTSFWTGQCWLAHEVTGDGRFRDAAET